MRWSARQTRRHYAERVAPDKSRWDHSSAFSAAGFSDRVMRSINLSRFAYSLAGRLLSQPWSRQSLRAMLIPSAFETPLRIPKLTDELLAAFAVKPAFAQLAAFLQNHAGLRRALLRRSISASPRKKKDQQQPPAWLNGIRFPELPTEAALARWFEIDPQHLRWRADLSGRNRRHSSGPLRTYRYRWIPKKHGPPRLLEIPKAGLKQMQRKILREILDAVPVHPAAHGFCAGRSIVTNAKVHCGKPALLRFDLTDFFPSVSSARVFRIFRTIGYPPDVARLLMGICTTSLPADIWNARATAGGHADFLVRQRLFTRHLPQGAPTSPALANLAAGRLDRRLASLAAGLKIDCTRYADDLTFSGGEDLARQRKRFATLVAVIAEDEGFSLNHRKTRLMRSGVRQHVTGVVVNVRPNVTRAEFDQLKAILTNCVRHGPVSQNRDALPDFRAHLAGRVAHVRSVHPARGEKLRLLLETIRWEK
jgi:RNA-directed DNA polymerase